MLNLIHCLLLHLKTVSATCFPAYTSSVTVSETFVAANSDSDNKSYLELMLHDQFRCDFVLQGHIFAIYGHQGCATYH